MRSALLIPCLILISLLILPACSDADPSAESTHLVIRGATLFDGNGGAPIENSVIVISDRTIDCVGAADECMIPMGSQSIDGSGKFITPGLVDAHMHFFQTGFFDSRPDAMDLNETYPFAEVAAYQKMNPERYYQSYVCSGVTAVYDVGGMSWSIDIQNNAEELPLAPHVAAAGPLITPVQGAPFDLPSDKVLVPLNSAEDGIKTVQYLSGLGSTGIKFWTLRTDDEYLQRIEAAAEEIEKQGNQMIVHATRLEQAKAALRLGAKMLVHSVEDTEVDQEFIDLALENGTFYNPTLIVGSGYMLAYRAAAGIESFVITDPDNCVDPKTRALMEDASQFEDHPRMSDAFKQRLTQFDPADDRVAEVSARNLKTVFEAGIPVVVGTDAGNPGTLHGISIFDEMEAMQDAGIPAEDLIIIASKNGAASMRRLGDFGTLEAGKFANLILLDNDPSEDITNMRTLSHVMIKGELKPVEELGF